MLYVVRHAKAGDRSKWQGPDELRPLSAGGWRQAEALADWLAPRCTQTLISSPYVRCMQTLQPLATMLGVEVTADARLAEGREFDGALELLLTVPDGAVLCSHGDVIPDTINALERRGCMFHTEPDWRKASVWELVRTADGRLSDATCWSPPAT